MDLIPREKYRARQALIKLTTRHAIKKYKAKNKEVAATLNTNTLALEALKTEMASILERHCLKYHINPLVVKQKSETLNDTVVNTTVKQKSETLNGTAAAEYLGISRANLAYYVRQGRGPTAHKTTPWPTYKKDALDEWALDNPQISMKKQQHSIPMLTLAEAAERAGLNFKAFTKLSLVTGGPMPGPPSYKIGQKRCFKQNELDEWIKNSVYMKWYRGEIKAEWLWSRR